MKNKTFEKALKLQEKIKYLREVLDGLKVDPNRVGTGIIFDYQKREHMSYNDNSARVEIPIDSDTIKFFNEVENTIRTKLQERVVLLLKDFEELK